MAITRLRKFGVLLGTGAALYAGSAMAGFELVAPAAPPPQTQLQAAMPALSAEAAMPIVPSAPVTSESLMPMDYEPAAPVTNNSRNGEEPVYVRRQRTSTPIKAPASEPTDAEALLMATASNADVEVVSQNASAPAGSGDRLVINPYPLQDSAAAGVHNGGEEQPFVEQAMMEQAGSLRPVAVPGQGNAVGMAERARVSGRHAGEVGYLVLPESYNGPGPSTPVLSSVTMTPIPGGEDAPLPGPVHETSLAPTPIVPSQVPAMPPVSPSPVSTAGYTDAVGFGRDLPLPLALSQVIPSGYSYALGQNVDLAANVSWQGGKPWDQVLNDMLAPSGMIAIIQSNQVTIQRRT